MRLSLFLKSDDFLLCYRVLRYSGGHQSFSVILCGQDMKGYNILCYTISQLHLYCGVFNQIANIFQLIKVFLPNFPQSIFTKHFYHLLNGNHCFTTCICITLWQYMHVHMLHAYLMPLQGLTY